MGRVRWQIAAIIVFTGTSTILVICLAVAALNVMVRREGANVVEKQIQVLVQASQSVAPAILNHAGSCTVPMALLDYTDEAFPQGRASLIVDRPDWVKGADFSGLVVDHGELEIRHVVTRQKDTCKVTAVFSLPLGPELAKRLSSATGMSVAAVSPKPFRVHSPDQRVLRTMEGNFVPGMSRTAAVVLAVRDWQTGAREDWIAFSVRPGYLNTFEDVARLGGKFASWIWLGAALGLAVLLLDATGVWMCIRLGLNMAAAVDDLSRASLQIGAGNFAWRAPVRSQDQLGELSDKFNEMAIALERLKKEEAATLRMESELQVARSVQESLFPRVAPVAPGVTVSGRTLPARTIGGDLYDFFDLGRRRIGILCADVSGKGIPAALMMANLQAIARAHAGDRGDGPALTPSRFVEALNQDLAGRFGNNRYATLFWAVYDADTSVLTWVNAGNPPPIVIGSTGEIERLNSDGFPIGMFANAGYTAGVLAMRPGSRLVIFSDGLTDAQNRAEEEFGDERLIARCKTIAPGVDAEGVAEVLMQTVAQWSAGTDPFDDTTVVVVSVAP
jgi:sigma-B regulation protein RsbU (phosphoserine phosphatase)